MSLMRKQVLDCVCGGGGRVVDEAVRRKNRPVMS